MISVIVSVFNDCYEFNYGSNTKQWRHVSLILPDTRMIVSCIDQANNNKVTKRCITDPLCAGESIGYTAQMSSNVEHVVNIFWFLVRYSVNVAKAETQHNVTLFLYITNSSI